MDGNIIAQQNFEGGLNPYSGSVTLSPGYHTFDLFYFQTVGGYNLSVEDFGPDGTPIDFTTAAGNSGVAVPEPASGALLLVGILGIGGVYRRRICTSF